MKITRATFYAWRKKAETESTPGPKYCDKCGTANDASASYCAGCGQHLPY